MLAHYNGTSWKPVTATALTGLLFYGMLAQSSTNVWALAAKASGGGPRLVYFNGSRWTTLTSPYASTRLDYFAPDGRGGFWLDGYSSITKTWVLHRSASGQWSRTSLTSGSMGPIALVPGTTWMRGVGSIPTATGSNARIWNG